jgi:multidrug efflux pump subunit AcrB
MIKLAMRHGVGLSVAVLMTALFGFIALFRVPVQMTPDIAAASISILTSWPGATPQDIEKEILVEQEKYLRSLPDLDKMVSTASTSSAEIVLTFRPGVDLEEVLVRANNALSQVPSYPENVDQPRLVTNSASDQPIAWFAIKPLPGNPKNVDIAGMQDFIEDNVQTELERVNGVSQSQVVGGAPRQLRVYIDPAKLAERQISLGELRSALRARNRDISGGDLDEGKRRYLLRTVGRFKRLDEIEDCVIARRNGKPVYLRDVGRVEMNRAELRAQVRHNGEPALALNVRRQTGTNIIGVMEAVQEKVRELNKTVLEGAGLGMRQVSDDTLYIKEAVALVRDNLLLGGALAVVVLWLFLRSISATIIGALAVPICTVCSFLGLTMAGRTINVISLAGIAFAIGMTIDNSIVVLENIFRHRSMGKDARTAAYDGAVEVWGAVLASTLTTVAVFLPIVFVVEEAGQLFQDIAIAITSAIVFSMLVAITVVPSACARFLDKMPTSAAAGGKKRSWASGLFGLVALSEKGRDLMTAALVWLMRGVFRRVILVIALAAASTWVAWKLAPKTEYLPEGNKNLLFTIMVPPPGYNIQEMTSIGVEIENEFVPYVKIDPNLYAKRKPEYDAAKAVIRQRQSEQEAAEAPRKALERQIGELKGRIAEAEKANAEPAAEGAAQALANANALRPRLAELEAELERRKPEWDKAIGEAAGRVGEARGALAALRAKYKPEMADIPAIQEFFFVTRTGNMFVVARAVNPEDLEDMKEILVARLNKVPGMIAFGFRSSIFAGGLSGQRGIELDVVGRELPNVFGAAGAAFGKILAIKEFSGSYPRPEPSLSLGQPLLEIRPDWERAAELGVDATDLGYLVWALADGAYLDEFFIADDKIDMFLYSSSGAVQRTQDLRQILLYSAGGGSAVPLSSVAEVVETVNTETIRRVDRQRAVTLTVTPPADVALEAAVELLQTRVIDELKNSGSLPPDVSIRIGGASDKLAATREALQGNFLLAIAISYLLMVALFSHWGYPLIIMMSLPLGIVGGILGLHLMNHAGDYFWWMGAQNIVQPLDVLTMLGFVILIGTVVNNPILLVENALQLVREENLSPTEAVTQSAKNRIRPIMMSTVTTVFGLAPLVFLPGAGAELYRGLGAVVLCGLLLSTLFTLTFIPSLMSLALQLGELFRRRPATNLSAEWPALSPTGAIAPLSDPLDEESADDDQQAREFGREIAETTP